MDGRPKQDYPTKFLQYWGPSDHYHLFLHEMLELIVFLFMKTTTPTAPVGSRRFNRTFFVDATTATLFISKSKETKLDKNGLVCRNNGKGDDQNNHNEYHVHTTTKVSTTPSSSTSANSSAESKGHRVTIILIYWKLESFSTWLAGGVFHEPKFIMRSIFSLTVVTISSKLLCPN